GLGDVLSSAFTRLGLPSSRIIWAVPGLRVAGKLLDLPNVSGDRLEHAVVDEARRTMGVSVRDSYLFWQRLEGRIRRRKVYVVAVPKSVLLTALESMENAEIRPTSMDVKPLAL